MGTGSGDLIRLLVEYGWDGVRLGNTGDPYPWWDGESWYPKASQVEDHLRNGRAVIALVSLNTGTGRIDPNGTAPQWVSILQTVETTGGETAVRIFKTYQNREEWYSFDQIQQSWTPGPNYRAVVATPPSDLAWLPGP